MFNWLKELFKPIECYCICHDSEYDKKQNYTIKGGYFVGGCEHCVAEPKMKSGKWGTAMMTDGTTPVDLVMNKNKKRKRDK